MMYKSCTKATIKYDIYDPFNNYLLFFQQNRNPHLRKWRKIENILAKPKNVRSLFSASASNKILFSHIYFALNFRASSLARNKSPSKNIFRHCFIFWWSSISFYIPFVDFTFEKVTLKLTWPQKYNAVKFLKNSGLCFKIIGADSMIKVCL